MVLVHCTIHTASPAPSVPLGELHVGREQRMQVAHIPRAIPGADNALMNSLTAAQYNNSNSSNVCVACILAAVRLQSFTVLETQHSSSKPVVCLLGHTCAATADQPTVGGEPSVEQRSSIDRCSLSELGGSASAVGQG